MYEFPVKIPALSDIPEGEKRDAVNNALYGDNVDAVYAIIKAIERVDSDCIDRLHDAMTEKDVKEIENHYNGAINGIQIFVHVAFPSLSDIVFMLNGKSNFWECLDARRDTMKKNKDPFAAVAALAEIAAEMEMEGTE